MALPARPGGGGCRCAGKFYAGCAQSLLDFARAAARYAREGDKARSAARQKGKPIPLGPEPPEGCESLWEMYESLKLGRPGGGFSISPLSYMDIFAWSMLTGYAPTPAEVRLLLLMDRVTIVELMPRKPD